MQYNEVYRIVTTGPISRTSSTYIELDPQTSEAEAIEQWEAAQRRMSPGSVVQLHRVATLVVASASKA